MISITISNPSAPVQAGQNHAMTKFFENNTSVARNKLIPFLDYDDQERLAATSSKTQKVVKEYQRIAIPQLFDPFIKNLFPGGAEEFNALPIQVWRQQTHVVSGAEGQKAVNLKIENLSKASGQIPTAVIGVERNEADIVHSPGGFRVPLDPKTWEPTGPGKMEEARDYKPPCRPFLAIPVQRFRESRVCCLPDQTISLAVHVIYRDVSYDCLEKSWGALGPLLTTDKDGYKHYFARGFTEADKDCFASSKRILAGEVLDVGKATTKCNCCQMGCCDATPCAPFEALLYDTTVKMKSAGQALL